MAHEQSFAYAEWGFVYNNLFAATKNVVACLPLPPSNK